MPICSVMNNHPQYRFLQFMEDHQGEFDIAESYEELVVRKRIENHLNIGSELNTGNLSEETITKIANRLDDLSEKFSIDEVLELYQLKNKSAERLDILTVNLLLILFSKATSRQNLGEVHCENCLDHIKSVMPEFNWTKLTGKKSKWIENGQIVNVKPKNSVEIKSVDYHLTLPSGKTDIYCSQKRMKISEGGHQKSQQDELMRFAKETKDADGYIPVAILDGAAPDDVIHKITQLNAKVMLVQSNDLLYFIKWLKEENSMTLKEIAA